MDDLAAVNRSITPWVVLNGHRPIYTTSSSGGSLASVTSVAAQLRNALEDVLYQYEVAPVAATPHSASASSLSSQPVVSHRLVLDFHANQQHGVSL